jgi:hypothetical protein
MIVCGHCGEHNAGNAEFCGHCGEFLEWEGIRSEPVAVQPVDVREQAGVHRPQRTMQRVAQPGDLICGQCGAPNQPTRNFCAGCGSVLADARVVPQPWWRRWIRRRGPKVRTAGSRPRRRSRARTVGRWVWRMVKYTAVVLIVAFTALFAFSSPFRDAVKAQAVSVKEKVEDYFDLRIAPVRPVNVSATAETPGHAAALAADNAPNTYWAAPLATQPPVLTLTFDHEVDLRRAIVRIGIGADFQAAQRPKKLHLVYSTGKTADIELEDKPDPQTVGITNSKGATKVDVFVSELYPSLNGADVVISEIEWFERK